jgi:hypothetical protein
MKSAVLLLALASQAADLAPSPQPHFFRYSRSVTLQPDANSTSQACAVLDAAVFAHAAPTLADLRLFQAQGPGQTELPYAITTSRSTLLPPDLARVLNLGMRGSHIVFDLQMPARSYTELDLQLGGHDFLATATVTGLGSLTPERAGQGTALGAFTLYDLTAQHLARNTSIPLQESSFPILHVDLALTPAPGSSFVARPEMVQGAEVPPSREAQTLYTPVAQTTRFEQRGRKTIATLSLPAHVPVERITFSLPAGPDGKPGSTNFSRPVRVTVRPASPPKDQPAAEPESLAGEISRVHLTEAGQAIREESLSMPATIGSNATEDSTVEIAIENGDDRPVPLASATLEMRQRSLCFATATGTQAPAFLFYGDAALAPPVYDFSRLFNPAASSRLALLGPEQRNPAFTPRPAPPRSLTERYPELLWLALLVVIGVLAVVAYRSSKHIHPHHP